MSSGVKSAFILTTGIFISKAIGVFYRIPLSNILGAEGIGMYQLVFSVYGLIVTIIGSGIPIAVSRLTAETIARGKSAKQILLPSIVLGLVIGLFFTIFVFFLSTNIGILQGNEQVANGYKIIAPAIFFVSLLAVLKGYFQGRVDMMPTSISYILEQVIKLVVGLTLAVYLEKYGVYYAFLGSLIGVTASEIVAFVVLFIIYLTKKEQPSKISYKQSIKNILKIAFPITIGSMLIPLSQFLDSFFVINLLEGNGVIDATAHYGLYSGSVTPIVNMPVMLVLSLAMIIVPVVSKDRINLNYCGILAKSELSLKLCFLVGIPSSILLAVFSTTLLNFIYPKFSAEEIKLSSDLLKIASISVVFYGTMQIETSLMQGLDKIYIPIKNIFLAILVKEFFCLVLVKQMGIIGLSIATVILSIFSCILNSYSFHKILGKHFNIYKSILVILSASMVFFIVVFLCKYYILNDIIGFLVACTIGGSIYYILVRNNNLLSKTELKSLGYKPITNKFLTGFNRSKYDYRSRCRQK